jgi:hypothetical protein
MSRATDLCRLPDDELVDTLARAAFAYFERYVDARSGRVADTSRAGSPASIAVVGLSLTCLPIAVERGWMSRPVAAARALATLRAIGRGHEGFQYHFVDMPTGGRVWECELSVVDTALLMAGVVTAGVYFAEPEIADLAETVYRRVNWKWAQNGSETVSQGWKPECGFLHHGWEGYNEALVLYVLGLGSPTHSLDARAYRSWTRTYQWEQHHDVELLYSGPLFTHLFSHAWIDLRGLRDAFMREVQSDYFENTRRAIALQRDYAERNPRGFAAYDRNCWGITAGDGPDAAAMGIRGRDQRFFGYMARGIPYGPDDGTIAPWAAPACLPFDADAALAGTRHLLRTFPQVCPGGRFVSGFNPTLRRAQGGWVSNGWYGLDQGMVVILIENARSGLVWELFGASPHVRRGLRRAGFGGGWLGR